MDTDDYCREIEAHLCRRNAGHLVRLVGPAFDMVRDWAASGIPLKVAQHGIDRFIDRAQAKGPRRRPIRIEFCEADVLDAFDAWRRAVLARADAESNDPGGSGPEAAEPGSEPDGGVARRGRARESLSTHLDRVIVRLTALRAGGIPPAWDAALDETVRALDAMHPASRRARGDARDRLLAELAAIDARLLDSARGAAPPDVVAAADREAGVELEPFRGRLSPDAYAAALRRSAVRLLRDALHVPVLTFE
jgi:hypothetical protein